jgi:hypothetical protein
MRRSRRSTNKVGDTPNGNNPRESNEAILWTMNLQIDSSFPGTTHCALPDDNMIYQVARRFSSFLSGEPC